MTSLQRSTPHLRLTAAILVAMLAAIAAGLESTGEGRSAERNRRGELLTLSGRRANVLLGGLRLVTCDDSSPRLHLAVGLRAVRFDRPLSDLHEAAPADTAELRAHARVRLDASRARGAALLRTTVLPPPAAC